MTLPMDWIGLYMYSNRESNKLGKRKSNVEEKEEEEKKNTTISGQPTPPPPRFFAFVG